MGKILIWIAVGAAAWLAWKFYQTSQRRIAQSQRPAPDTNKPAQPDPQASPERMVACAHCGVHLPASESVSDPAGRAFCGAAHLEASKRRS